MKKLFFALSGILLALLVAVDAVSLSGLVGGAPFAPGTEKRDMPSEWTKKPVKHSDHFKDKDLVVTLDHISYRVLSPVIEKYSREKGLNIAVIDGTCGNSLGFLYRKQIDIGGLCCPPAASDRLPGLRFYTLGITPLAAIVHEDNPIDGMTLRQLRKIYAGEIHYWSESGLLEAKGMEGHILPVVRLHCKNRPGHWRLLLDREELFTSDLLEVGTIPDMISSVATSPDAIGLASLWLATDYYSDRWKVKAIRIDGQDPKNLDNIVSGGYPFYRVMSITLWEEDIAEESPAFDLAMHMMEYIEREGRRFDIIPSADLEKAGWKFRDRELVGEPK